MYRTMIWCDIENTLFTRNNKLSKSMVEPKDRSVIWLYRNKQIISRYLEGYTLWLLMMNALR